MALATCQLISGVEDFEVVTGDTGPDAGVGGAAPACGHATVPAPPTTDSPGNDIDFTVAVRTIDLGEDNVTTPTPPPGLDIDGLCSCQGEGASCTYPKKATAEDYCDYDLGLDNAAARVFYRLRTGAGVEKFGSAYFNEAAEQGRWSLLLRVRDYNGEANDTQVTVAIYEAGDLLMSQPTGPTWDGSDAWPVSSASLMNGDLNTPVDVDVNAYVTDHVLVASVPAMTIRFQGSLGFFIVKSQATTISATIQEAGGAFRLVQGVAAGRWRTQDVLFAMDELSSNGATQPFCNDGGFFYEAFKSILCQSADTLSALGSPKEPCDAISFGMAFTADPASLGAIYNPPPSMTMCPPGQRPSEDACPTP